MDSKLRVGAPGKASDGSIARAVTRPKIAPQREETQQNASVITSPRFVLKRDDPCNFERHSRNCQGNRYCTEKLTVTR
jgi:hypothetical protein